MVMVVRLCSILLMLMYIWVSLVILSMMLIIVLIINETVSCEIAHDEWGTESQNRRVIIRKSHRFRYHEHKLNSFLTRAKYILINSKNP